MSTDLDIRPDLSHGDTSDEPDHIVCCCSMKVALCGKDVSNEEVIDDIDWDGSHGCKRCLELEDSICVLCGLGPQSKSCYCGTCW